MDGISGNKIKDLTGQKFNNLTVLNMHIINSASAHHRIKWKCRCSCGKIILVRGDSIRNGSRKSCGCAKVAVPNKKIIDLTGRRYNSLTVIKEYPRAGNDKIRWICRCNCGKEVVVAAANLKNNHTKSCGCYRRGGKSEFLAGQRFGKLVVIRDVRNKGERHVCECACDCGNKKTVERCHLVDGDTLSCGCLRKERTSEANRKELAGLKFGRLTVVKYLGALTYGNSSWLCKCDCGNDKIARTATLTKGAVQSCGCLAVEVRHRPRSEETKRRMSYANKDTCMGADNHGWNPDRKQVKLNGKIGDLIHSMLRRSDNGNGGHSRIEIGWKREDFQKHIESLLPDHWTMDDWGILWEVDHIKPIFAYLREKITDPKVIHALSNLRPLGISENRSRMKKYDYYIKRRDGEKCV